MKNLDKSEKQNEMTVEKLLKIRSDLENLGVSIILDGGWGVDALVGIQTRSHKDIDFLIERKDLDKVKTYFSSNGFLPSKHEPATDRHFVLESPDAIADIHIIELDESGNGIYGSKEMGASFPANSLKGEGKINGIKVRCLSAEYRVKCLMREYGIITRTGYELKNTDYVDIAALCKKYNIPMPEEYVTAMRGKGLLAS